MTGRLYNVYYLNCVHSKYCYYNINCNITLNIYYNNYIL